MTVGHPTLFDGQVRMGLLDLLAYPLLAVSVVEVALGVVLLRRGGGDGVRVRRTAAAFSFAVGAFALAAGLTYAAAARGLAYDVLYRMSWCGWLAIPAGAHVLFALDGENRRWSRVTVASLYAFWGVVCVLAVATDLIEAAPESLVPFVERTAPLEELFRAIASVQTLWIVGMVVRLRRRARGHERLQISYFLLGLLIFAVGGGLTSTVLPLLSVPAVDPALASWFALPSVILVFVAITRHRLFGVTTVVGRALGLLALVLVFGAIHLGLFLAFERVLDPIGAVAVSFGFSSVLIAGTPVRGWLRAGVEALVQGRDHVRHAVLRESAHAVVTILDPDELVAYLTNVVGRGLGAGAVAIYVAEPDGTVVLRHAVGGPAGGFPDRVEGAALWTLAQAGHRPVPANHLGALSDAGLGGLIGLPLQYQDGLQGVVLLGPREDGAPYLQEDFEILETLGYQAAIALANARLYHEATTDDLTELYHRKYFFHRLEEELERSRIAGRTFALLMVDIDHFKRVNDSFGHPTGDRILKAIAWTLLRTLRHPDIAARFGGEEFAVLLADVDAAEARRVAERIRQAVERERYAGGAAITVSVGVAVHTPARQEGAPADLVAAADHALYEAKRGGRNCVCVASVIPRPLRGPSATARRPDFDDAAALCSDPASERSRDLSASSEFAA